MARRAIAAADDNAEVLESCGYALGFFAGETETALSAIDRALALNRNSATAFGRRALVLFVLDRPEEAILAAEQAIRLSPLDPLAYNAFLALSFAHLATERYEEAMSWVSRAVRENGGLPALRLQLSLCGHLGRRDDAIECLGRIREIYRAPTITLLMRNLSKAVPPKYAARLAEGLRKAGLSAERIGRPSQPHAIAQTSDDAVKPAPD